MGRKQELTDTELELMEAFWSADKMLSFRELLQYANEDLKKDWKKQTLSTYIKHLKEEGIIGAYKKNSKYYYYYPIYTKAEYLQALTKQFMEKSFSNSLSSFIAAFTGGGKISSEDAEELKKYIK